MFWCLDTPVPKVLLWRHSRCASGGRSCILRTSNRLHSEGCSSDPVSEYDKDAQGHCCKKEQYPRCCPRRVTENKGCFMLAMTAAIERARSLQQRKRPPCCVSDGLASKLSRDSVSSRTGLGLVCDDAERAAVEYPCFRLFLCRMQKQIMFSMARAICTRLLVV